MENKERSTENAISAKPAYIMVQMKVQSLEEYAEELKEETKVEFENVVGQDSLTRFDSPKRNKKRRNNRNKNRNRKKKSKSAK